MEDLNFLFSFIAMILSLASVILVVFRIGIGLGVEFVEKKEIREMRKEIDDRLREEWIIKLHKFLDSHSKDVEVINQEKITQEIVELGEATRYTQTASTLLKVLSKMIFDIVKFFIGIILMAVVLALSVWVSISFPEAIQNLSVVILGGLFFFGALIWVTIRNIRTYLSLRSQFYDLSENPSLSKAKDITEEIEEKELIYA